MGFKGHVVRRIFLYRIVIFTIVVVLLHQTSVRYGDRYRINDMAARDHDHGVPILSSHTFFLFREYAIIFESK